MESAKMAAADAREASALADVKSGVEHTHVRSRARTAARVSQFIDYGFGVIYLLLVIRLALGLMAASAGSGFVQFIHAVTNPFYAPFRGIVSSVSIDGGNMLVVPILVAIAIYALLHVSINGLLRMVGERKTEI
jgi:uncharacterized protein YggT (Ycf19 family)